MIKYTRDNHYNINKVKYLLSNNCQSVVRTSTEHQHNITLQRGASCSKANIYHQMLNGYWFHGESVPAQNLYKFFSVGTIYVYMYL